MKVKNHLMRHKWAYEQHKNGMTYKDIGIVMGVSATRARDIAMRWKSELLREQNKVNIAIFAMRKTLGSAVWFDSLSDEDFAIICDEIMPVLEKAIENRRQS